MAVTYVPYGTVRVSRRWATVLRAADRANVAFHVTSGHRTFAEQQALFNQNMIRPGVPKRGRPMTAVPSHTAPHIRTGKAAHALDVNSLDGGETRLQRWLEAQGARPTNPVSGESWHLELSDTELKKLATKLTPAPVVPPPPKKRRTTQRTSAKGRDFIARQEGVVPYAYNDPAGHATFGIGHLIHHGPVTAEDKRVWGTKANPKDHTFVMKVFAADLKPFEAAVRAAAKRRMYQHRFDAAVSLAFNIGTGGFANSTVAKEIRLKHPQLAADAFLMWSRPIMLRSRRLRERALFLTGNYTP